jgi:ethanolamine utilization protein EutN
MIRARVSGRVWSTRRIAGLPPGALLEVTTDSGARLIAFDPLGCAHGEMVLVTQGSVAAAYFPGRVSSIDALIVGSINEDEIQVAPKTKTKEARE